MLSSVEIESALENRGFWLEVNNTHARGYRHAQLEHRLYVKTNRSRASDPLTPMCTQPLVIHPDYQQRGIFAGLIELSPSPNLHYRNASLSQFPKANTGTGRGIAIDVEDRATLDGILAVLGVPLDDTATTYDEIMEAESRLSTDQTTRKALIDARLGQGKFRDDLISYWRGCAITGCSVLQMVRASHIKPWRCSSNEERLDSFNGLLLTANLDQAFDRGLISFTDEGVILINKSVLHDGELRLLGIGAAMRLRAVDARHKPYLAEHRRRFKFEK